MKELLLDYALHLFLEEYRNKGSPTTALKSIKEEFFKACEYMDISKEEAKKLWEEFRDWCELIIDEFML